MTVTAYYGIACTGMSVGEFWFTDFGDYPDSVPGAVHILSISSRGRDGARCEFTTYLLPEPHLSDVRTRRPLWNLDRCEHRAAHDDYDLLAQARQLRQVQS